ncbi:MAG TPA: S24 family peptidase [Candidatus Sulfopaludibacter sp.]|jgi:SOS-response transcriptional repressor LexA|nr:S24 family peptidase [Candidatus Sulfopaludibacter sp.]
MPAPATPISARQGIFVVLEAVPAGRPPVAVGLLLVDPQQNRAWLRFREAFDTLADSVDAEILEHWEGHARQCIEELGAEQYLASLEDSLSNTLRVSERRAVPVDAFSRVLDRLFREHVEPVSVQPFRTHLPLFSLRAAAGSLGEEMESTAEDWVPAPEGMRLTPDLFVAHVVGQSMEPRIPDGSLNLFRLHPVGSRQNKILLIQRFGSVDETARYTVKRYTSRKAYSEGFDGEAQWQHEQIRLEPLNPEYSAWDVGPEDFAVVAEWLKVIE